MIYIGIDLGGTNIVAGLVDATGHIIHKASMATLPDRPIEKIVDDIVKLCFNIVDESEVSMDDIAAVGVGCPGFIDNENGIVIYSNNIRMKDVKLREMLMKKLNKPVNIENDANAAALGEYSVHGDNTDSFVFVTLGTGVGGGIIIDGKLYRGFNGAGGEIGHIVINTESNELCTCGNRGCWETYASVTALIRQTKRAMHFDSTSLMHEWVRQNGSVSGKTAFDCAKMGDRTAQKIVDQYIKYIGSGLISILNIFQPKIILIGGGISKEGSYLINPLREYVYDGDYNKYMNKTQIEAATLFNDAGVVGAALSAHT